jgi:hypothetical protein
MREITTGELTAISGGTVYNPCNPCYDPCHDNKKPKSNAGRGNGSEYDNNGNEIDPGNSGGHNNGGDF